VLQGRRADAQRLLRRLVACCNDVGLLSEELDPKTGHMLGNFPQAYSHVGLINSALNLTGRTDVDRAGSRARAVEIAGGDCP
jgi:GH15 family glucan-1,4-alpha-glucosidase